LRRVPYLLAIVLDRSKRFQVTDPLQVSYLFAHGGAYVQEILALPERAVRISKRFDVSGWIVPVLLERRGVVYLDVTWISAVTGTALFSRREPLLPPAAAEEQRFPWEPASEGCCLAGGFLLWYGRRHDAAGSRAGRRAARDLRLLDDAQRFRTSQRR